MLPAWWLIAAICWLGACAIPLAVIDMRQRRLPDVLTGLAYGGTVALLLPAGVDGDWTGFLRSVAGGLALALAFLILAVVSGGALGLGDVKLAASLGTALAWFGWPVLVAGVLAGFATAAGYGIVLLAARRATWRQQIPFGPFMIAGAFALLIASLSTYRR